MLKGSQSNVFLAVEIDIERALRRARDTRDIGDGRIRKTAFGENLLGSPQDLLAPRPADFLRHANAALAHTLDKNVFISLIYGIRAFGARDEVLARTVQNARELQAARTGGQPGGVT